MIRSGLIIDLDGTFYDSKEIDRENQSAAIEAISKDRDIPKDEAKKLLNNFFLSGQTSIASALETLQVPSDLIEKYQLLLIHPETYLQADPELAKLLRQLRKKFRVVLFTNTRRQIAIRALHAMTLQESDFDLIVAGGDMDEPKPSVNTLVYALKAIDCEASISYTVGDRWIVDHEPGQQLGMRAIEVKGRDEFVSWLKEMLSKD